MDDRQRPRVVEVGQRLADGDLGDAGDGDDVTGVHRVDRHPVERVGDQQLGDLDALDRPVDPAPGDLLAAAQLAADDAHSASRPR